MPTRLAVVLATAVAALGVPAAASARVPASKLLIVTPGTPLAEVQSLDMDPLGWSSTGRQAMVAAEHSPVLQALHRRMHPLQVIPYVWRSTNPFWYVVFKYRGKVLADANVSRAGKLVAVWTGLQALMPYTHGGVNPVLTSWLVLLPASLLFLLPFLDPGRLRRVTVIDALAILAFLASYLLNADGDFEPAIWLAYPPLIYLLVRLVRLGFGGSTPSGRLAPLLSTRVLTAGLPLLLGARIALSLLGHQESDVGYESVIGAFRILHHLPIYWNDPNHGDTYGPIAYLVYVPFELLFPWANGLSSLHAADAAAIFFDLGTVAGLVLLGRHLRPGREGTRLGLVLAWAWAACPFTVIALIVHTNDGLICMLSVFALLAISSPVVSGGLLGLAAAAKISPAALLPVLAAPRQRGVKGALVMVGVFSVVVATAVLSWLPPGGLSFLWQRTIEFQLTRPDVFSPWGIHPALRPVQTGLEVLAVMLVAAVGFVPRERSLTKVCALAGAVTIAIQLPAAHWYYYYIIWFVPFVLIASLGVPAPALDPVLEATGSRDPLVAGHPVEPALAGA